MSSARVLIQWSSWERRSCRCHTGRSNSCQQFRGSRCCSHSGSPGLQGDCRAAQEWEGLGTGKTTLGKRYWSLCSILKDDKLVEDILFVRLKSENIWKVVIHPVPPCALEWGLRMTILSWRLTSFLAPNITSPRFLHTLALKRQESGRNCPKLAQAFGETTIFLGLGWKFRESPMHICFAYGYMGIWFFLYDFVGEKHFEKLPVICGLLNRDMI